MKMKKPRTKRAENKQRNQEIVDLRKQRLSYKQIGNRLNITTNVVNQILRRARNDGKINLPRCTDPYSYLLQKEKVLDNRVGRMSEICNVLGIDCIDWILRCKPDDLNFAEFIGVMLKDEYLEDLDG
jgi:DNA-binding CsgD family transcriptional regulator